jgi:hypothetical protein
MVIPPGVSMPDNSDADRASSDAADRESDQQDLADADMIRKITHWGLCQAGETANTVSAKPSSI